MTTRPDRPLGPEAPLGAEPEPPLAPRSPVDPHPPLDVPPPLEPGPGESVVPPHPDDGAAIPRSPDGTSPRSPGGASPRPRPPRDPDRHDPGTQDPDAPRRQAAPRPLPEPTPLEPADLPLYDALRDWRRRLAAARGVPAYLILHNRTLAELAKWRPASLDELRRVRGIGEAKALTYGAALLAVVQAPCAGLTSEDALARVTALLLAGDYEVTADAPGALVARPRDGGPGLWIGLMEGPAQVEAQAHA